MARSVYPLNQLVRNTATFTVNGTPTDPTTITATVRKPNGTTTAYVYGTDAWPTRSSAGIYVVDIVGNASGIWRVRFEGTGAAQTAVERMFVIDQSEVL